MQYSQSKPKMREGLPILPGSLPLLGHLMRTTEDIPVMLGEPARLVQERYKSGQPTWRNPTEKHGKRVWYSASIGNEPHIADVILERVCEGATAAATP